MFRQTIILTLLFALLGACSEGESLPENNELKLPALSQEGKQYLACLVNGELFLSRPYTRRFVANFKPIAGIFQDSILYINGQDNESMDGAFIGLANIYKKNRKIYDLSFSFANYFTRFHDNSPLGGNQYKLLKSEPHQMEIHHEDENIIAGTFFFSAVSELGDTVRITDGRFDLKKGI